MSITKSFSPAAATASGSAHGPAGLGAAKTASASHRSCHAASMRAASAAS